MAYLRKRGSHLAIVHGERDAVTGKVVQRVLATLHSQAEARDALGSGTAGKRFRSELESNYPSVDFEWGKLVDAVEQHLAWLPVDQVRQEEDPAARLHAQLVGAFGHLASLEPAHRAEHLQVLGDHRHGLQVLADLIEWQLRSVRALESAPLASLPAGGVTSGKEREPSPAVEEFVEAYLEAGKLDPARAGFGMLVESFPEYAEGHNYLGIIALERGATDEAVLHFERAMSVGRKRFPKRIAKGRYWTDLDTRPYVRALRNLALALNLQGKSVEALRVADRLETECGDRLTAESHRARAYLNAGQWNDAYECGRTLCSLWPSESIPVAFALFEMGAREEAATYFLHAALNGPQAALLVVGVKQARPEGWHDTTWWNEGVWIRRSLAPYLNAQRPRTKRYFRRLVRMPQVQAMLDEIRHARLRNDNQRVRGEREAFDRIGEMTSLDYARDRIRELAHLLGTR
jgi:tetratricopeptide (TPR) repeat protein